MTIVPTTAIDATSIRDIYLHFFSVVSASNSLTFEGIDPIVESTTLDTVRSWGLPLPDKASAKYARVGIVIACAGYRHAPTDVKIAIALYTVCSAMSDDNVMSVELLREFSTRLFDGRPQLHPVLTRFVELLKDMRKHYGNYSANVITVSTADFFNAEMFNRDEGGTDLAGASASEYIDYIRWKTGVGEAYAIMIWPRSLFPETKTYIQAIPPATQYICLANDLLSYHKEVKAGETDNYVSQYGETLNQSPLETLQNLADRVIALHQRIITILGNGPERKAWETFASGYNDFHIFTPRYSLNEIIPEYYSS